MRITYTWGLFQLITYKKSPTPFYKEEEGLPKAYADKSLFNKLEFKHPEYRVNLIFDDEEVKNKRFPFQLEPKKFIGRMSEEYAYLEDVVAVAGEFLKKNKIQADSGVIRTDYFPVDEIV